MTDFRTFVRKIRARQAPRIEPEVDKLPAEKQRELREQQDLKKGAVTSAVLTEGSGAAPASGDLVVIQFRVLSRDASMQLVEGAVQTLGGEPVHVAVLGQGVRLPRAWELVLTDMKAGQINAVYSDEGYGFVTGEDHMAPPSAAVQAGASLATVLRLLTTMPGSKAKVLPVAKEVLKVTRQKGPSWETAREPHEVTFSAASGAVRPDLDAAAQPDTWRQRTCALGGGALPRGVELALCSMAEGERATFVMPRRLLRGAHDASWAGGADATDGGQWQLDVELASFVEVRDMTGEGKVVKRKVQKGTGTFPVDAPIIDATVRLHYAVFRPDAPDAALYSTCDACGGACRGDGADAGGAAHGPPAEVTTGEGDLPQGVELAVKLMLPGERCTVTVAPEYGFATCAGAGVAAEAVGAARDETLLFALWLVSFTPEGHPQAMTAAEVLAYATKQKEHANALYRGQRAAFAVKKYDHAVSAVKRFRGESSDAQAAALTALQASLLANLAAAYMAQSEFAQAIRCCDAAFQLDPDNLKLVLRRGKASSLNGDYDDAAEAVAALREAAETPEEVRAAAAELAAANERRRAQANRAQKKQFGNLFAR